MLKHVHSSPHRSSSTSIRRNVLGQESPKHIRDTSNQSLSFCITCSSKNHSKSTPNRSNSPLTVDDNRIILDNHHVPSLLNDEANGIWFNKSERDSLILSPSSNSNLQPVRLRTISEPPVICPKCFKKKRKPLTFDENDKEVGQKTGSPIVKEVEDNGEPTPVHNSSFLFTNDSLKLPLNKNIYQVLSSDGGTTTNFFDSIGPRCSTPVETQHKPKKSSQQPVEDDGNASISSSPSSPSQSSASLVTSFKSPLLRSKDRKSDEKQFRGRLDNLSLDSSMSCSTSSREDTPCSLSSSAISLPDNLKAEEAGKSAGTAGLFETGTVPVKPENMQSMIRIWVRCLMQEMEYKTICVTYGTTCRQVVQHLLSKFRMKHRDPNLFYLAMEVTIKKAGAEVRTCLRLDDTSFPAQLVECHPKEFSRLALRMRRGGLIRIYDEAVSKGSHYKSLLVGEKISCIEVMRLVLACNKVTENVNRFALLEVWPKEGKEKILDHEEEPMVIASEWEDKEAVRFEMRRISNSTGDNVSLDDVMNHTPSIILPTMNDNDEKNAKPDNNANLIENLFIDNFGTKQTPSPCDEEKNCDSNLETADSSSFSSDYLSSLSSSPPLQSKLSANNTATECKYLSKLKENLGNLDPKSHSSHAEIKHRRKLPKTPSYSSRPSKSLLPDDENESEDPLPLNPKINFKTYNDYENYFYI